MAAFFRFPHTPHTAWLGEGEPRDDKLLGDDEAQALLQGDVIVEEKVDGACLGFSTTEEGELQAQNRGSYLSPDACHPQFRPLWKWLAPRSEPLFDALWPDLMLFGEWCFAVHSIRYTRLPDWFLGFDVYDRGAGRFWDTSRRDKLLGQLGLARVPLLARGQVNVAGLRALLGDSRITDGPMEGLVVRRERNGWTEARGKLVRAEFTQAMETHWTQGPLMRNGLAMSDDGVVRWPSSP